MRLSRGRDGREPAPQITSVMVALAFSVLHSPDDGESARVLARMVLEAAEAQSTGPGRP